MIEFVNKSCSALLHRILDNVGSIHVLITIIHLRPLKSSRGH